MDGKRTAFFYIILILRTSISTPLESSTSSVTASHITSPNIPTDPPASNDSIWNSFTIWGTVVGSCIFTTIILGFPCCLGFFPSGIRAGSAGASMMSYSAIANGGGVEAGGCVATCQSIGALGICTLGLFSATAVIVIGAGVGAALGFGIGVGLKKLVEYLSERIFNSPTDSSQNRPITDIDNSAYLYPHLRFAANETVEPRLKYKRESVEILNVSSSSSLENSIMWPTANVTSNDTIWNQFTLWGAVAGAVILTPLEMCIPYCLGFAAAGIRMGSLAASMMSCSAGSGGIVAGSCVAIFQSIGALGVCSLGFVPIGIIICINAAIGFGVGYGVLQLTNLIINKFSTNSTSNSGTETGKAEEPLYQDGKTTENGKTKAMELGENGTSYSSHSSITGNETSEAETVKGGNIWKAWESGETFSNKGKSTFQSASLTLVLLVTAYVIL